jgi:hypothetical protein
METKTILIVVQSKPPEPFIHPLHVECAILAKEDNLVNLPFTIIAKFDIPDPSGDLRLVFLKTSGIHALNPL